MAQQPWLVKPYPASAGRDLHRQHNFAILTALRT
jgi:hypothetical protein